MIATDDEKRTELALQWLAKSIAVCKPEYVLPPHLHHLDIASSTVIALGKAAPEMVREVLKIGRPHAAMMAGPRDVDYAGVSCFTTGHPFPNEASFQAGDAAIEMARKAERLVVLLSGGSSAAAVSLSGETKASYRNKLASLFKASASIETVNQYRRSVSNLKDGKLGGLCKGDVVTLAISDVIGDGPSVIGSGPTAGTTDYRMVARNEDAIAKLAGELRNEGYHVEVAAHENGEGFRVGMEQMRWLQKGNGKRCLISGGEVVSSARKGSGGPNHEFLLGIAMAAKVKFLAAAVDSDGFDGSSGAAGGLLLMGAAQKSQRTMIEGALQNGDSAAAVAQLGQQIHYGHTGTNVNDLRLLTIEE